MDRKKITIIMFVILIIVGFGGRYGYQRYQAKQFTEYCNTNILPLLNSSYSLTKDMDKLATGSEGRTFDNLFKDANSLKEQNNQLKLKVNSLTPANENETKARDNMSKVLDDYDEGISDLIIIFEQERTAQIYEKTDQNKYNSASKKGSDYMQKYTDIGKQYIADQKDVVDFCHFTNPSDNK